MRNTTTKWLLSAVAALAFTGGASAEELKTATPSQSTVSVPHSGLTMEKVEAEFGTPSKRVPAVGEPPIARWEYPSFTVYFEHERVIHTVVTTIG
jgi:hypothetical protein